MPCAGEPEQLRAGHWGLSCLSTVSRHVPHLSLLPPRVSGASPSAQSWKAASLHGFPPPLKGFKQKMLHATSQHHQKYLYPLGWRGWKGLKAKVNTKKGCYAPDIDINNSSQSYFHVHVYGLNPIEQLSLLPAHDVEISLVVRPEPMTQSALPMWAVLPHIKVSVMLTAADIKVYCVINSDHPKPYLNKRRKHQRAGGREHTRS